MDDNFGEWVESMGVASGLECIGVVSGWCCEEVYPHNNYYFSLLHLY